jgi:hypothetical protein
MSRSSVPWTRSFGFPIPRLSTTKLCRSSRCRGKLYLRPGAPGPAPGTWESATPPLILRKILLLRRTMRIVKPMNELATGVEVASVFPRLICQGSARSVPTTRYHLINTPPFIFKTLRIISEPPCSTRPQMASLDFVFRRVAHPESFGLLTLPQIWVPHPSPFFWRRVGNRHRRSQSRRRLPHRRCPRVAVGADHFPPGAHNGRMRSHSTRPMARVRGAGNLRVQYVSHVPGPYHLSAVPHPLPLREPPFHPVSACKQRRISRIGIRPVNRSVNRPSEFQPVLTWF